MDHKLGNYTVAVQEKNPKKKPVPKINYTVVLKSTYAQQTTKAGMQKKSNIFLT